MAEQAKQITVTVALAARGIEQHRVADKSTVGELAKLIGYEFKSYTWYVGGRKVEADHKLSKLNVVTCVPEVTNG